jgi:hypothetical protein
MQIAVEVTHAVDVGEPTDPAPVVSIKNGMFVDSARDPGEVYNIVGQAVELAGRLVGCHR